MRLQDGGTNRKIDGKMLWGAFDGILRQSGPEKERPGHRRSWEIHPGKQLSLK